MLTPIQGRIPASDFIWPPLGGQRVVEYLSAPQRDEIPAGDGLPHVRRVLCMRTPSVRSGSDLGGFLGARPHDADGAEMEVVMP